MLWTKRKKLDGIKLSDFIVKERVKTLFFRSYTDEISNMIDVLEIVVPKSYEAYSGEEFGQDWEEIQ